VKATDEPSQASTSTESLGGDDVKKPVAKKKRLDLEETAGMETDRLLVGVTENTKDENVEDVREVVVSGNEDDGKEVGMASDKCGNVKVTDEPNEDSSVSGENCTSTESLRRDDGKKGGAKRKRLDLEETAGVMETVGDENVEDVRVVVVSGEEDDSKKVSIAGDKCGNDHFL